MTEVASLSVSIGVDKSGFDSGMKSVNSGIAGFSKSVSDGMKSAGASLTGLGASITGLGAPFAGIAAVAINSFAESEKVTTQLDAVLKSTEASMVTTAATAGHWANVTKASGENVAEWKNQLESAQTKLGNLQAKQAAGIALSDSEKNRMAALSGEIQNYQNALNGATTTAKVWVAGQAASASISHLSRQAYIDLASSLQKITPFTDEAVLSAENMLLTFTKIGKEVFPDATKIVLDMSTALGQDTKASAMQLGKALNDPISGVTALRRVGVQLTDQQEKQIKAFVRAGDILSAQKIILGELTTEFGGSAEAAGKTFAGSLEILKNRGDDVLETLGGAMIPTVQTLTGVIGNVIGVFENLSPPVQQLIANVVLAGASLAVIGPVIAGIGLGLTALAPVVAVFGGALALLVSPLGLAVAGLIALGALAGQVIDFGAVTDSIETGLIGALNDLKELTGFDVVGLVNSVRTKIEDAFSGGAVKMAPVGVDRSGFQSGTTQMSDDELAALAGIPPNTGNLFTPLGQKIAVDLQTAVNNALVALKLPTIDLSTAFTPIVTDVTTSIAGLDFSSVGTFMQAHFTDIVNLIVNAAWLVFGGPIGAGITIVQLVGTAIANNFLGLGDFLKTSGISDTVTTAFNDLKTTIDDAIATVFGGAQAAQPPGGGLDITAGLTDAVKPEKLTPLQLFASDLQVGFDAIKKVASDVWDELKPGFDALGAGITGFVGAFANTDTEGLLRVVTGIAGAIGALIAPLIELGAQVAGDVLTNLGNALPQIGGFISNLVSAISDVGKGDFAGVATDLGQAAIDIANAALNLFGIQITIPDFTAAIEGWRIGLAGIKAVVDDIVGKVLTAITDFAGGIKNKLIDLAQAFLDFRITLANLVGDSATVASLQTSKADWESQRYVPQAGAVPGAATGASVMRTGAVLVHSGERILNKQETAAYSGGAASSIGQFIVNQTDTDTLLFDLKRRGIDLYMMAQGQGA